MGFEIILGCLLFSGMVMTIPRAVVDAIATVKAANAGKFDLIDKDRARRAARAERWQKAWDGVRANRHRQAGGTGEFKPGAKAYLSDVYTGWWEDRINKRRSKREQRGPAVYDPNGPTWRDRVDQAVLAGQRKARAAWAARGNTPTAQLVNETVTGQPAEVVADEPRIACEDCGQTLTQVGDEWRHPSAGCPATADENPTTGNNATEGDAMTDTRARYDALVSGLKAAQPGAQLHTQLSDSASRNYRDSQQYQDDKNAPGLNDALRKAADGPTSSTNGGSTMPTPAASSAGSATGDAHDVETAIQQCNLLDDDLTAINTALDVIDNSIDSAGSAAEHIRGFLAAKNVDDAAVGGMSVAQDMLSPTHIKALMDAIAAAKGGVKAAMDELVRLQELESQLNGADGSVLNGR